MADPIETQILSHLKSERYRPQRPRGLARELSLHEEQNYHAFRDSLRELMDAGRVVLGQAGGTIVLPSQQQPRDEFTGTYRHNRRGFGFVVPTDPTAHEDLYIPEGQNGGAITGDIVRAKITSRGQRDGKTIYSGRITEIIQRTQKKFVGTLVRKGMNGRFCRMETHLPSRSWPRCRVAAHQAGDEGRGGNHGLSRADGMGTGRYHRSAWQAG